VVGVVGVVDVAAGVAVVVDVVVVVVGVEPDDVEEWLEASGATCGSARQVPA
jgi:hypothetical protein